MSSKLYLPGLNGFRAMAALAVVFSHINLNLDKFGFARQQGLQLANFGVTIFFTLSGFLITYLLLQEKKSTGTVSIRKFYVRRILRIWPLYFFYMLIVLWYHGFHVDYHSLAFYIFFAPNVPFVAGVSIPLLSHYWSLGVEEQFYAFWPLLVRQVKKLLPFLIAFVIGFVLLKVGMRFYDPAYIFLHYARFGCMAIGGVGACILFAGMRPGHVVFHIVTELLCWCVVALFSLNYVHVFSVIDHEIVAAATAILILNQVANPNRRISLENRPMDFLGKISFGMYVYNPLLIDLVAGGFSRSGLPSTPVTYVLTFVLTPLVVIGVAYASYRWLERPFLDWKTRFEIIKSSNSKVST